MKTANFDSTIFEEELFTKNAQEYSEIDDSALSNESVDYVESPPTMSQGGKRIPGSDYVVDEARDHESNKPKKIERPKTWQQDRAVDNFMDYLKDAYPNKIPKHDGTTVLGCKRAIKYIEKVLKEISEAIRKDDDNNLDVPQLESTRINMMKDIIVLRDHMSKLEKKIKEQLKGKVSKASLETDLIKYAEEIEEVFHAQQDELTKTAFHPKIHLTVTAFERAISGIIINAVIAGGKPIEEVFEYLREKYDLDIREELAIMQIIMDSGFPIFKDRGTLSENPERKMDNSRGIEYIKQYFS